MNQKTRQTRRTFVASTLATTLATAVTTGCSPDDKQAEKQNPDAPAKKKRKRKQFVQNPDTPNILYITADDLGTRLGAYGHDIDTPNIDALAQQGILFEECHAQSGICGGSRTSILTGLRPETSGVDANRDPWRGVVKGSVTLPRHFLNNGYKTFAVGKIEDGRNGKLDDPWFFRMRTHIEDMEQVERFMARIGRKRKNDPFLACVGFQQPHCPWTEEFRDRYPNPRVLPELGPGREVGNNYLQNCVPGLWDHLEPGERITLTEDQALDLARGYLAAVTQLDTYVGRTLELARENGLLENTIVIFWSGDHGYALGDHDQWGKWIPKQSISRIPLIIRFPDGRHAGTRVKGMVEAVDMYPTLLEITGLSNPPQELDGVSWVPMLGNPDAPGKDYVFTRFGKQSGVSDGRWNFIRDHVFETEALFDRKTDPDEVIDVIKKYPDIANRLRARLDALPSVMEFETLKERVRQNREGVTRKE